MRRGNASRHVVLALLLACTAVVAQELPPAVRERIETLPVAERQALYARQAALRAMTPAQRSAFVQRLQAWKALPEAGRRQRRERWQAWQALPAGERAQVVSAAAAFAALPVQAQIDLRQQYARLDDGQQHGWLLGPTLGVDWTGLQPLLLQVPPGQRVPLLAVLRAMSPRQRGDLGVLAQRTPPQARDALRRQLLAVMPANRDAWLQQQLDR